MNVCITYMSKILIWSYFLLLKQQTSQFCCLPFALTTSPNFFNKVMKPRMLVLKLAGRASVYHSDE